MSPRIVVIADDFTGGNAVAANFAATGARVVNVALSKIDGGSPEVGEDFDVVVITTSSRHDSAAESASKTTAAASWIPSAQLFSNRIDTTLRGNICSSTSALLGEVRAKQSHRVSCLCVPAHPAAGRQTIGGQQLLRGARLEETELASDPLNPMPSSDVVGALTADATLKVALISLDVVTAPVDTLAATLRSQAASFDVLVVDALTEQHLDRIAAAAAKCTEDIAWITADPGPFTAALALALGLLQPTDHVVAPILAVSGSATVLTRRQLQRLVESRNVRLIPARGLITTRDPAIERSLVEQVTNAMATAEAGEIVLVATALDDSDVRADPAASAVLAQRLARIAVDAAKARRPAGLYITGGDVTAAVLDAFEATGLAVDGEVVPLAVTASLVGGPWAGTPVVTKGGLIGDMDTAVACIAALESRLHSTPSSLPLIASTSTRRPEGES